MNITEVRVKMVSDGTERLRAFCSVTLDGAFVVRDLKVIDGPHGPFVAMPSRKLSDRCTRCRSKNHLRARFCNECGFKLNENRAPRDSQGRIKLHADVAHPINSTCRDQLQTAVIEAYREEAELSKQPGYRPRDDVVQDDEFFYDESGVNGSSEASADAAAASQSDDGDSGHDQLIAELRETVARKKHGRSSGSVESSHVSESTPDAAAEASQQVGPVADEAPETAASQQQDESNTATSASEEDDFSAGIL